MIAAGERALACALPVRRERAGAVAADIVKSANPILAAGLSTLWVGGETSRRWSNRLMRYRVLAQFVAILIVLAVLYFVRGH